MSRRRPNDGSRSSSSSSSSRERKGAGVESEGYCYEMVEVRVVSAEGLRRVAWTGKNQPVAVAWVNPLGARRTGVARDGGSHPVWNQRLLVPLRRDQLLPSQPTWALKVQVLHHHRASFCARLRHPIGTATIPAAHILQSSAAAQERGQNNNTTTTSMIVKYPLRGFLGRPQGAINLIVRLQNRNVIRNDSNINTGPMTAPGGTIPSVVAAPDHDQLLLPNSSTISGRRKGAHRPPISPKTEPWPSGLTPNVVDNTHNSTLDFAMPTKTGPQYSNTLPRPEAPAGPQVGEDTAPKQEAAAAASSGGLLLPRPTAPPSSIIYMDPRLRRPGPPVRVDLEPAATSSQPIPIPIPIPIPRPGNSSHKKEANANANEHVTYAAGWTPSSPTTGNMNQTPHADRSWPLLFPLSAASFTPAPPRSTEKKNITKSNDPTSSTSRASNHDVPLHGKPISPHHQYAHHHHHHLLPPSPHDVDDHHNPALVDELYSPYHEAYAQDMEDRMHHAII